MTIENLVIGLANVTFGLSGFLHPMFGESSFVQWRIIAHNTIPKISQAFVALFCGSTSVTKGTDILREEYTYIVGRRVHGVEKRRSADILWLLKLRDRVPTRPSCTT